jgi:hypothetical protein
MDIMLKKIKVQVSIALTSILTLIGIGTISFKILEGWTWIQCFYFSVSTLTTVGFGDLHPTSDGSRLFTAFYILVGVTIGVGSIGIIGSNYILKREERILSKRKSR